MNKIILGLICIMYSGCAITSTSMIGDVTTYTQNGEILQKWEQVVLQEVSSSSFSGSYTNATAFKTFGINFYDKKSGKYIIIGNAVPYIIEYSNNIKNADYIPKSNEQIRNEQIRNEQIRTEQYKNELINQWKELSAQEQLLKSKIKDTDKSCLDYQNLKDKHQSLITQIDYISDKLWTLFGLDTYGRDYKKF